MTAIAVIFFFLGAAFGSFAGVISWRLPRTASICDRSRCEACGKILGAADMVPVLSWIFRKGKCSCGASVSWCHPVRETLCGAVAVFFLVTAGELSYATMVGSALLSLSFALAVATAEMDAETGMVSDAVALPALAAALAGRLVQYGIAIEPPVAVSILTHPAVFPALTGGGMVMFLWAVTLGRGIGDGDIAPMATLSALSFSKGIPGIDIFFFSALVAVTVTLWKTGVLRRRYSDVRAFPFIPVMLAGWMLLQVWTASGGQVLSQNIILLAQLWRG